MRKPLFHKVAGINDKIKRLRRKYEELSFPDSLKLFSRKKTSSKAGNILSFLGSSVILRTLPTI